MSSEESRSRADNLTSWVWDGDVVQIAEGFGDGVAGHRMPDGRHVNPLVAEDENIKATDERLRAWSWSKLGSCRRSGVGGRPGDVVEDDPAEFHPHSCQKNFIDILPLPVHNKVPDHNSVVTIDSLCGRLKLVFKKPMCIGKRVDK